MANNVGIGTSRVIVDVDGEAATVTSNRLDVNATLVATPTIDIGDVSLLLGGTAADTGLGVYGAQTLRVTLAADDTLTNTMITTLSTIDTDTGNIAINTAGLAGCIETFGTAHDPSSNGIAVSAIRNDALESFINPNVADGDYTWLQVNSIGGLYVTGSEVENAAVQSEPLLIGGRYDSSARTLGNGDAGAIALNASGHLNIAGSHIDDAAFTLGTDSGVMMMGFAGTQSVNANDATALACTTGGILKVDLHSSSGTITIDSITEDISINDGGNSITVDNGGTFATQVDGDALTALQLIDDAVYVDDADWTEDSSKHLLTGGVRSTSAVTSGDTTALRVGSTGSLIIDVINGGTLETAIDDIETALANFGITGIASDDNDTVGTSAEKISGADGDVACKRIDIMAHPSNTGYIWIGDSAVTTNGANGGIRLGAGDFYSMDIDNTGDVYAVATVDGENVCFNYFT